MLNSTELHTDQLLEAATKLLTNYAWCIEEIRATPSIFEKLLSYEASDFDDLFNNAIQLHVIKNYLRSSKADRDGDFRKKTRQHQKMQQRRSIREKSEASDCGDLDDRVES